MKDDPEVRSPDLDPASPADHAKPPGLGPESSAADATSTAADRAFPGADPALGEVHLTPARDSAGVPWSGRELAGTGFEGDLGAGDPSLLAALDSPLDEMALMRAVAGARLLVPIVAVPSEVGGSGDPAAEQPGHHATSIDMAVVTLTAPDGQRVFPVFSSLATLAAWDDAARPSPVTSSRAAQGAVSERCDLMLLDCGSARELVLRPSMVWALAQQRAWLPAHTDPFVAQALSRATAGEDDVIDCVGEADPAGAGTLRVVLTLRPGLDAARVQALATRIGEQIATDGEARARIDGLAFTVRHPSPPT